MNQFAKSTLVKSAVAAALFPLILTACGKKEEAAAPAAEAPAATATAAATGKEDATCATVKFCGYWLDRHHSHHCIIIYRVRRLRLQG